MRGRDYQRYWPRRLCVILFPRCDGLLNVFSHEVVNEAASANTTYIDIVLFFPFDLLLERRSIERF
jgi:hypothetical protein